ncbi:mCG140558, partial [Mus musculus]
ESVPFQWSELTRGPSFIWHATHQKSLSQKQFSISTPGVSQKKPRARQAVADSKPHRFGAQPSGRAPAGPDPGTFARRGRGTGEGFGGGAA